jgi:HEAT repeat protein
MPPELEEWMKSLGQENVQSLSVRLLVDLLTIETDAARATELAADMEALAEDLLMSGAYQDAQTVAKALAAHIGAAEPVGRDACLQALDQIGGSRAMHDTAALIGEFDETTWAIVSEMMASVGHATVDTLLPAVAVEQPTLASHRAASVIVGYGAPATARLGGLVGDPRWFVQCAGARLLGRIAAPQAVPLLQPLLRQSDIRVAREAVAALCAIDDPSAARAIHSVLRAATGELRHTIVGALVADRDPRVVPVLARILDESHQLGADHHVVLDTMAALGDLGGDQAVPSLGRAIQRRAIFRRRRLRALKERGIDALSAIATPRAMTMLDEAARTGDRMLRKAIRRKRI